MFRMADTYPLTADLRGQLHMQPGDALLARPIDRGGDPQHDCLQALCGALYVILFGAARIC